MFYLASDYALSWISADVFHYGDISGGRFIAMLGSFWAAFWLINRMTGLSKSLADLPEETFWYD
jgi:hypothetical protein